MFNRAFIKKRGLSSALERATFHRPWVMSDSCFPDTVSSFL